MKRDCPSQRTYVATDAGYISASDVEDDDDTSDDAGDDDAIDGDAATSNFRNIIVQRVHSAQPQTSEQLCCSMHNVSKGQVTVEST
jgi:hypothetical protein